MKKIRIGSKVTYRPRGEVVLRTAEVLSIQITSNHDMKQGRFVKSCDLDRHKSVILDLDDGHWCWGDQVRSVLVNKNPKCSGCSSGLSWIKVGARCRWNDPGIGDYAPEDREAMLKQTFTVVDIQHDDAGGPVTGDSVLVIEGDFSMAEVLACEVSALG